MMNRICEELKDINLTGNIVPPSWFDKIKTMNGRTDLVAINILSDIIYWYRPKVVRDESSGAFIRYEQKFKADMLQKSYLSYAEMLGVSKRTVMRSFQNLERLNLIRKEFRNIHSKTGLPINNVMYVEPILENILEIPSKSVLSQRKKSHSVDDKLGGTNTESTSKINTEISPLSKIDSGTAPGSIIQLKELIEPDILLIIEEFPKKLRPVILEFCKLWKIPPPKPKKEGGGEFAYWIMGAENLLDACGEFGAEAVRAEYENWSRLSIRHKYDVKSPMSIARATRAACGPLREARKYQDYGEKPFCLRC
jgi:hypothetical protein